MNEYEVNKRELSLKETMLKELGELDVRAKLDLVNKTNFEFTEVLEKAIQDFGLTEVSLFRVKDGDGELTEEHPKYYHKLHLRYVFKGKDGYYTNGLLLRYSKALKPAKNQYKRLHHFELGQKI